jgi:hypothetical protein
MTAPLLSLMLSSLITPSVDIVADGVNRQAARRGDRIRGEAHGDLSVEPGAVT